MSSKKIFDKTFKMSSVLLLLMLLGELFHKFRGSGAKYPAHEVSTYLTV